MSTNDPINDCLRDLRRRLRFDPLMSVRVLREVSDHLADSAEAERRAGASADEAQRRAVTRFGDPAELVCQLGDHTTLRLLSLAGAAGSLLVGALLSYVAIMLLPAENADSAPIWTAAGAGFLVYGATTWLHLSRLIRVPVRSLLAVMSAGAVLAGVLAAGHSLYQARVTGDWEIYVTCFGAMLSGHGAMLLAYLALSRPGHVATPEP